MEGIPKTNLVQSYLLIVLHTITSHVRKNKLERVIVNVGVTMNDVTYKALFTGIVIGLTFSLVIFMVGFYAK